MGRSIKIINISVFVILSICFIGFNFNLDFGVDQNSCQMVGNKVFPINLDRCINLWLEFVLNAA